MANTVITSTTNLIKFVFDEDISIRGYPKAAYKKSQVFEIELHANYVSLIFINGTGSFEVTNSTNTSKFLKIDSVDGVAPSSLSDLYDKIEALIA